MPREMHYRDFTCEQCGSIFQAARSDARFCKACGDIRKDRSFEQRHKERCIDCGASITRRGSRCRACDGKFRGPLQRGEHNPYWRGGKVRMSGYIYVLTPSDPKRRYTAEHVLIWEQANGPVPPGWHVHHLNGQRTDNRIENLAAQSKSDHHASRRLVPYERRILALESELARTK